MTDLHGFEIIQEQYIEEVKSQARLLRHIQTGAELLSLENTDEHKAFGISFRTPPPDATGIAHILEHSVLCGSRKYPVKEPFVELLKGSLKTFLNALTYPDKTCYPVASQNTQDFYNLIDVYLDAVFYPRITREIFEQEGWHYEMENPDAPLTYRGVVFNEMKGAYSSPERLLSDYAEQSLFPDTPYGVDSGGDPSRIPDLTYEQFRTFHQTYYHPSNACIFFYGDDSPEERLRIINEYLKDFQHIDVSMSAIPLQPYFDEPKYIEHTYVVDPDTPSKKRNMMTVNWLLEETADQTTVLSLQLLGYILVGMLASPLRKALVDSGFGEDLTGGGIGTGLRQLYFSTGLKGIAVKDSEAIQQLIVQTLTDLVQNGIDSLTIEAAINTLEFYLREQNTGSLPRGLSLMFWALTTWLHNGDPLNTLAYEKPLAHIKERLAQDPRYFESLIERYILNNMHRTTVILKPDATMGKRMADEERARLDEVRQAMSAEDRNTIIERQRQLKHLQETPDSPEALATIPRIRVEDLDKYNKTIPLDILEQQETPILHHDLATNGIVYLDIGFNMQTLPQDLLPYLPLFARSLREMGTEKEDYTRLAQRIGRKTGGLRASWTNTYMYDKQESVFWFMIRTKAVLPQAQEMLAILQDILLHLHLDNQERFRQIVLEAKAREEATLVPHGNSFVSSRLRACFNKADWASELMDGVSYLFFLRELIEKIETDWPSVLQQLERIRSLLVNRQGMLCNITLEDKDWQIFSPQLDAFLAEIPVAPFTIAQWNPTYGEGFEALIAPSQVNYVGKAANLYDLGYTYTGSMGVIARYLNTTWLWEQVRLQGGAYGCSCGFGRHSGIFSQISYRDPHVLNTLTVYDQMGHFLRTANLSDTDVQQSIIGTIGGMDTYLLPDAKGYTSMIRYLTGETDDSLQQIRDQVLATTVKDFRAFADMLDYVCDKGIVTVLGSSEAIEKANAERGSFLKPLKVL